MFGSVSFCWLSTEESLFLCEIKDQLITKQLDNITNKRIPWKSSPPLNSSGIAKNNKMVIKPLGARKTWPLIEKNGDTESSVILFCSFPNLAGFLVPFRVACLVIFWINRSNLNNGHDFSISRLATWGSIQTGKKHEKEKDN